MSGASASTPCPTEVLVDLSPTDKASLLATYGTFEEKGMFVSEVLKAFLSANVGPWYARLRATKFVKRGVALKILGRLGSAAAFHLHALYGDSPTERPDEIYTAVQGLLHMYAVRMLEDAVTLKKKMSTSADALTGFHDLLQGFSSLVPALATAAGEAAPEMPDLGSLDDLARRFREQLS